MGGRGRSSLFFHMDIFSYFSTICGKNFLLPIGLLWCLCQKCHKCGSLSALFHWSIWYVSTTLSWLLWVNSKSWNQVALSPPNLFFFEIAFAILSPLHFHINFRIILSISRKNSTAIFIGISFRPQIDLWRTDILTILGLP